MVLKKTAVFVTFLLAAVALRAEAPRPGEVTLPLSEYLALVEAAERAEKAAAVAAAQRETPAGAVTEERVAVLLGEDSGLVETDLSVLVQGNPKEAVALPLSGLAESITVEPAVGAAVAAGPDGTLRLVATRPGRYRVRVRSRAALADSGGVRRFPLAPVVAPVASTELDLPADLAWTSPGAVVVEDRVEGARRKVRLASRRGESRAVELRRRLAGSEAEKLLAQSVVLTILQLRPEGARRHDVVLYEVSRGSLDRFTVDLPVGLKVEQVGTEEGSVVPVVDGGRLTAQRRRQLLGVGYLVLTSTPGEGSVLPLAPVVPAVEVRARYFAVASSIAAETALTPEGRALRVDLSDLPSVLSEALEAFELSAAWRIEGPAADLAVAIRPLPAAPGLPGLIRKRETTTLATGDGTLLFRDRLTVEPTGRPSPAGTVVELQLPPGAALWSVSVAGQSVRPLEQGGKVSIPLGAESDRVATVEVVSVVERAIPEGRSRLSLELPQIATPVLEHRWRLLLPERAEYRFRSGELNPAREGVGIGGRVPGGVMGGVVGGVETGAAPAPAETFEETIVLDDPVAKRADAKQRRAKENEGQDLDVNFRQELRDAFKAEADSLRQGLVGGVKPLPVTIPEEGKSLLLTGFLPPARVTAELEVRAARR